ncbi:MULTISPECIES: hypothetical protein [Paenibacillus]|nr:MULTISPECIES: hypothetical protein [Paenibacillus]NTZ19617.1 hypothetical protein [Paenibacillus sp. JMULE4]GCL73944.1 hypothetical protein PN4B1_38860 [Paenibacillus naphthalenovorans]SDJ06729.1 hypothetical protein SAMN05421868_11651 [Paenibacillus naphthalenovorans]
MKACCNKMKPGKKVSVFLPVVISFLATQHWFHALIFLVIGGSATTMLSMEDMILFRRAMIVLTLGTLLWSVYQIVRDGWKNKKMIVMTSISFVVSMTFVIVTLVKMGW